MQVSRRLVGALVGAGVLVAVPIVVYANVGAEAATETLLSKGRPVAASSIESDELGPANAVDGNPATRWSSEEGVDPQWIRVDLGGRRAISRVMLRWEAAYAKVFQLQVSSDGTDWATVRTVADGDGGADELTGLAVSGRYLRVYGTARGTRYGYSLFEFEVYGSGSDASGGTGDRRAGRASQAAPTTGAAPVPSGAPRPSKQPVTSAPPATGGGTGGTGGLADPVKKDIAMQLVSSAENSSLDWKDQYKYIEDIGDGRGFTAGIIGFCSGTGDMLDLVEAYTARVPGNVLAKYLPALRKADGSASHAGLENLPSDWKAAAGDPQFTRAQDDERDRVYFDPAVQQARSDGLGALGQFAYYDAMVMHGPGPDRESFGGIRKAAMARVKTPAQGGDQVAYLTAFLDARATAMRTEAAHSDTSRVDTAQRAFLKAGNLDLQPPLTWNVYGESYRIN